MIRAIPLRPAFNPSHVVVRSFPNGVIQPIPVMTTRRSFMISGAESDHGSPPRASSITGCFHGTQFPHPRRRLGPFSLAAPQCGHGTTPVWSCGSNACRQSLQTTRLASDRLAARACSVREIIVKSTTMANEPSSTKSTKSASVRSIGGLIGESYAHRNPTGRRGRLGDE